MRLRGHPRPLFVYFRSFQLTLHFLQQINVIKCQSNKRCRDSNPLELESPPITTRPGQCFRYRLPIGVLGIQTLGRMILSKDETSV